MIAPRLGAKTTPFLLALVCVLLVLPAIARAADPLAVSPSSSGGGGLGTVGPTAKPSAPVSVTGDGVTLSTTSAATLRGRLTFSGSAPANPGAGLEIERRGPGTDYVWTPTLIATVAADGSFQAVWRATQSGRFAVRAILLSGLAAAPAAAPPTLTVTVYPTSRATVYGPGFYGRQTACGAQLTRTTIGVANRSLPCGTSVSILYHGRTLVVPVVDRGPYANAATWDLTSATAQALGIDGTERIGTIALTRPTVAVGRRTHRG